jgi:hypothetical protein
MPEEIVQETGSSIPSDSRLLTSNLSPAQRQFAEVLGNCLAGHWRKLHSGSHTVASDGSEKAGSADDKKGGD